MCFLVVILYIFLCIISTPVDAQGFFMFLNFWTKILKPLVFNFSYLLILTVLMCTVSECRHRVCFLERICDCTVFVSGSCVTLSHVGLRLQTWC